MSKQTFLIMVAVIAPILAEAALRPVPTAEAAAPALTGQVSSQEEGPMEGVLVSARRAGSTVTISVVSDYQGHYSFPQNRLEPGQYSLSIRAVGYEADPSKVQITPRKSATVNLKLHKTQDLPSQLTNAEWLMSMPGAEQQKTDLLDCVSCHTLQRIVTSHRDATEFTKIVQRMSGYASGASPLIPQRRPFADRNPKDPERYRKAAEFLSGINLSKGPTWEYSLKMLPRPKGRSTHVIVTEYDLLRPATQPHDVVVDSEGMVWYSDFGQQYIGKLDQKTGEVTEYTVPILKADQPTGVLDLQFDKDGNLWVGTLEQAGAAKFDKKTKKFQMFPVPADRNDDSTHVAMVAPKNMSADGKLWMNDGRVMGVRRLDLASGKWDTVWPYRHKFSADSIVGVAGGADERHSIYDIAPDSRNNLYFTDRRGGNVGRVDAKTLEVKLFPTPTRNGGPRRGEIDSQDRLWYGADLGNLVGMFDTRTEQFHEWPVPTPWTNPYDAAVDKNGEVWGGGMASDRIVRVDSKNGRITEYLLPRETNVRRVFVDSSTTPVTFWVGNNHHASVIKLEPLD